MPHPANVYADLFEPFDGYTQKERIPVHQTLRAHIANVTIEPMYDSDSFIAKLVPEILASLSGRSLTDKLPAVIFCTEIIDPSWEEGLLGVESCYPHSTFNEFSTINVQYQSHAVLVIHAWLEEQEVPFPQGHLEHLAGLPTARRRIPESDTFFALDTAAPMALASSSFHCGSQLAIDVVVDGNSHRLRSNLGAYADLHTSISKACRDWRLGDRSCAQLSVAVARQAAPLAVAATAGLPPPQTVPSPAEPFVFLHHEKCAGTSLRRMIALSALAVKAKFHVPCFDPINATGPIINLRPNEHPATCMSFDLTSIPDATRSELAVIAGHFEWGVWAERAFLAPSIPFVVPRVFVMLRDPVARVISLYYERLFPITETTINNLSSADLEFYLKNFRGSAFSAWRDEGFSDAGCRMLCGLNVHKGKRPEEVVYDEGSLAAQAVDTSVAIHRVSSTVVGLTHRWEETKTVLSFWFSWIDLSKDDIRGNTGGREEITETPETLRPEYRELIENFNRCDLPLYEAALVQFEHQLDVARAWSRAK